MSCFYSEFSDNGHFAIGGRLAIDSGLVYKGHFRTKSHVNQIGHNLCGRTELLYTG